MNDRETISNHHTAEHSGGTSQLRHHDYGIVVKEDATWTWKGKLIQVATDDTFSLLSRLVGILHPHGPFKFSF